MVGKLTITGTDRPGSFLRIDYGKVDASRWMDRWNRAFAK